MLKLLVLLFILLIPFEAKAQLSTSAPASRPGKATLAATGLSAANAIVTVTLPAVVGQFHYVTSVFVHRTCTAAITGTANLNITTTNLPGAIAWSMGNACAVGSTTTAVAVAPSPEVLNVLKSPSH